jgi:hypothetical protein
MKCRNCGRPKEEHKPVRTGGHLGWFCPNGSGDEFPATVDVKVELLYRAGSDKPWVAEWEALAGAKTVSAGHPLEVLEAAGRLIEKSLEEKPAEELDVERAIDETRRPKG